MSYPTQIVISNQCAILFIRFSHGAALPISLPSQIPFHMYNVDLCCNGDLSRLPGDDDLLCPPIEINKRLFIDNELPIVISIG